MARSVKLLIDGFFVNFINAQKEATLNTQTVETNFSNVLQQIKNEAESNVKECLHQLTILNTTDKFLLDEYILRERHYLETVREAYLDLRATERQLWAAHSILDIVNGRLKPDQKMLQIETLHKNIDTLQEDIKQKIQSIDGLFNKNPFFARFKRHLQLKPFFSGLDSLLAKEKDLDKRQSNSPNNEDYAAAKSQMEQMRLKLKELGIEYIKGDLTPEDFKKKASLCIHNPQAREVLDKHREHPYVAEFLVILKNLLSILALGMPILMNRGFFKAPTDSCKILDEFERKSCVLY